MCSLATRNLFFLVNPKASGGRVQKRLRSALAQRRDLIGRGELVEAESLQRVRLALRAMPERAIPVAVGGDGTINMLVRALHDEGMAGRLVATVPLGTGNAFAHAIGIGTVGRSLDALWAGEVRSIDYMVTTHPEAPVALVSISAGFESAFLRQLAEHRRHSPMLGAARGMLGVFRRWRDIALTLDGETFTRAESTLYNAGLYNHRCYAKGRVMLPDADDRDGRAEAVAYHSARTYWSAVARGGVPSRTPRLEGDPTCRRWSEAWFETSRDIQVDGEAIGPSAFAVRVEKQALRVVTMSRNPS